MMKYKGDIEGFPKEVVEWMLDQQFKQTGKRDITVFENERCNRSYWGGFDWAGTKEGSDFCRQVIEQRNFDLSFNRYPKQEFVRGEVVDVSSSNSSTSVRRVYFATIEGVGNTFVCVNKADEQLFKDGKLFNVHTWEHARKIPQTTILTAVEAEEKLREFGVTNVKIEG